MGRLFIMYKSLLIILMSLSFGICQTIKIPLANNGIKGWITVEQAQDDINFKFDLNGFQQTDDSLKWSIYEIPLLTGRDKCWKLKESKPFLGNLTNLPVKNGKVVESVKVKGKLSDIDGRSLALQKKDEFLVCTNILLDSTSVFQSKFYGPDIAGFAYYFYNNNTKQLKIHSRIINANNFDVSLKWSLKKYWWLMDLDQSEPGTLSCKEKASSAYSWLTPAADQYLLHPETLEMITVASTDLTPSDLSNAVFVLDKLVRNNWEKSSTVGCAKVKPAEPVTSFVCIGQPPQTYKLQQKSPFHPLLITLVNESLDCSVLSITNISQPANQIDLLEGGGKLTFDTTAALPQSLKFESQIVAVAQFIYPIVGKIFFYQSKGNPDSPTIVNGWLQSIFDNQTLRKVNMTIMKLYMGSDLDAMTCSKYKDLYNPSIINQDFCQKSSMTCPVGVVPYNFTVSAYNATSVEKQSEYVAFVAQNLPLDGPFTIIGQTLQINLPWGQACANITLDEQKPNSTSACSLKPGEDIASTAFDLKMTTLVANFNKDTDFYKGNVYLFQEADSATKNAGLYFKADNYSRFFDDYKWDVVDVAENSSCGESQSTYNPFGVKMDSNHYSEACRTNPLLCAFGDVSGKFIEQKSLDQIKCIKYLSLSGYFNVQNAALRVRSKKKSSDYYCSKLKLLDSSSVTFGADSKFTVDEIKNDITKESSNSSLIKLLKEDRKNSPKNCFNYRLTVIAPNSLQITSALSEKLFNSSSLSKTLRSDTCSGNGAHSILFSNVHNWLILLFYFYFCFWCSQAI